MICSMFALTIAPSGLVGKMSMITFIRGGAVLAATFTDSAGMDRPAPGWKAVPKPKPMTIAKAVVSMYQAMVLIPMRPTFLISPRLHTPITKLENTKGTMTILIMFIKMVPKGPIQVLAKPAPSAPSSKPAIIPRAKPIRILVDKFTINNPLNKL